MLPIFGKSPLLFLSLFSIIAITGVAHAQTQPSTHSCVVQENIDSGGYTYIRCREEGSDIWLATIKTRVSNGENISFPDSPPMVNFASKTLHRTFPKLVFVPGISRSTTAQASTPEVADSPVLPRNESTPAPDDSMYTGTDDKGTLIFTDDPSRAPKSAKVKRAVKKIENATVLENFSTAERKLVSMLEKALNAYCAYDMPGLKAITTSKYWPTLWEALEKEGNDRGATFLRNFCFSTFRADTVKHFREMSQFDGATSPFADMRFTANRTAGNEDREVTCTASFIKEKKGWKYIDILCGADRVSYP